MKPLKIFLCTLLMISILAFQSHDVGAQPNFGKLVRLDPRFDRLVPRDAVLEKIVEGFTWVEGPVWNRKEGYLLFSDIPNNAVFKWQEGKGVSLYLKPSGYTGSTAFEGKEPGLNGLTLDASGRLVFCQHGDRRIARLEMDGSKTVLSDRYQGRRLNSPNDLVFKSNGDLYFTDPPFGLAKAFDDPRKELPFQGVYRLSQNGELTLLIKDLKAPNGIAFSPDEKILYVTDVDPAKAAWRAYDVREDGTVINGRIFFDAAQWKRPPFFGPDGLKVDGEGNIFGARPGGISIFAPDGTHLGSIETGVATSNCTWGMSAPRFTSPQAPPSFESASPPLEPVSDDTVMMLPTEFQVPTGAEENI